MRLRELKQQIEWMEEHGYDLDETEVRVYDAGPDGGEFWAVKEAVEDDTDAPKILEIHIEADAPLAPGE